MRFNGGTTMRDAVRRIENHQRTANERLDCMSSNLQEGLTRIEAVAEAVTEENP